MKRISIILMSLCLMGQVMMAQSNNATDKSAGLSLAVLVEDFAEPFPATARQQMETKLTTLLTQNGVASADFLGQFFISAKAVPVTKDILPGPPQQIAENMEITFYIADYWNQLVFSTATVTTQGVGTTEAKSYMNAIKSISVQNPKLQQFIAEGKRKVVNYYNEHAEIMMSKAQALAAQHEFDQALFILVCIPQECDKYEDALALGTQIWQQRYDFVCQQNLAQAKVLWAAEQNATGAAMAGEYLALIYPDAGCYDEAMELYNEIKGKVLDDWKFEMRKYDDSIMLEQMRIIAWREVGVAYGRYQQPVTTNMGWLH